MARKQLAQRSTSPTLALCVIARDEEQFIGDCLRSALPFVDEVVVLDTGSTDRTREIAQGLGARVVSFTWADDFAAARNAAIDAATSDWVFMLDADERLAPESGPLLRSTIAQAPHAVHVYMVQIDSQSSTTDSGSLGSDFVPRLLPRRPDVRFFYRIHEQPLYAPDREATNMVETPIQVTHLGYATELVQSRGKDQRNLALLEQELADEPGSLRAQYFLLRQHHAMQRYAAVNQLAPALLAREQEMKARYIVDIYRMYVMSLGALAQFEQFDRVVAHGGRNNLLAAEAWHVVGYIRQQQGRLADAAQALERALAADLPASVSWAPGVGGWKTRLFLIDVCQQMQNSAQAGAQLQLAYDAAMGADVSGVHGQRHVLAVARALTEAGAPDAALDLLGRVLDQPLAARDAYWLLVRALTALEQFEDATAAAQILSLIETGNQLPLAA